MVEDLTSHAHGPDGFLLLLISHIHRFVMVRGGAKEENVEQMRSAVGQKAALNHGFIG